MEKPKDLVQKALRAGMSTSAEGVAWLQEHMSYTMRTNTFGSIAAKIRKKHLDAPAKMEANGLVKEMNLAGAVSSLLKRYTADEIHRMVSIVSVVLEG